LNTIRDRLQCYRRWTSTGTLCVRAWATDRRTVRVFGEIRVDDGQYGGKRRKDARPGPSRETAFPQVPSFETRTTRAMFTQTPVSEIPAGT
jgi:hypothetical protein